MEEIGNWRKNRIKIIPMFTGHQRDELGKYRSKEFFIVLSKVKTKLKIKKTQEKKTL